MSDLGTTRLQEVLWASAASKEGGGSVGMPFGLWRIAGRIVRDGPYIHHNINPHTL